MKEKLRFLVLCVVIMYLARPGYAQLLASNMPQQYSHASASQPSFKSLKEVLQELKKMHNVDILYFDHQVEGVRVITDELMTESTVEDGLSKILHPVGLHYKKARNGGYVIVKSKDNEESSRNPRMTKDFFLMKKEKKSYENQGAYNDDLQSKLLQRINIADREISGNVSEKGSGEGLPGVNIMIKGSTSGTVSDANGNYSLNVPDGSVTLVFSFVGYLSQEVIVDAKSVFNVELDGDTKALEEVVVVGYGTQKKINLTGAVASVNSDVLESRPVANIGQALQGNVANLNISQSSGALGKGTSFNIRGNTSLNGGSPLVLVNGIPMDVNLLNPNDIENVVILKDAASAAIYGARAAYGVILITTKSGKKDMKPSVTFTTNFSVNKPVTKFETMDAMERMTYMNEANMRINGTPYYQFDQYYEAAIRAHYNDPSQPETFQHPNDSPSLYAYSANTDWAKVLLRESYPQQQHTLGISGGSDKFDYYTSFSYFNAKGITKNFDERYNRYNIMSNLNYEVAKWIKVGTKISINTSSKVYPPNDRSDNFNEDRNMFQVHSWPNWPVYHPDGNYASSGSVPNVLQMHKEGGYRNRDIFDSWMTGLVRLTPIKNVSINMDYSFNVKDTEELDYRKQLPMFTKLGVSGYYPYTNPSSVTRSNFNDRYHVFNAYADYENTFAGKHYFKAMVGFNQEAARFKRFSGTREKLIVPTMPYMNLSYGERFTSDGESEYSIRGAFSRINYSYDDRYLIEFNGRYDGSSKFPKTDRFAFFPSVSVGWRIDNEKFFEPLRETVNMLKLRVSYGSLGNQFVDNNNNYYPYIATYSAGLGGYLFNGDNAMAVYAPGLVSPTLTWEKVNQRDLGIDFALFGNRLNGSFDVYRRDTRDMLTPSQTLPATLAVAEPQANAADMKTTGFDMNIGWNSTAGKLRYGFTFILSDYKAVITKFSNPAGLISGNYVGKNVGEIWGLTTGGIFQTDEEAKTLDQSQIAGRQRVAGDLFFVDQDGDGKITRGAQTLTNHGDMSIIGNNTPRYSYGLRSNLSWKGFDLDFLFQGVAKRDLIIAGNYFVNQYNDEWGVQGKIGTDWWSETNRDAYFPRPLITGGSDVTTAQTRYMQNAAYLRLKQLTLSYTIPAEITQKIGSKRVQIYFSGNNVWEATKMLKIADPEQSSAMSYPLNRAFSVGANIGF